MFSDFWVKERKFVGEKTSRLARYCLPQIYSITELLANFTYSPLETNKLMTESLWLLRWWPGGQILRSAAASSSLVWKMEATNNRSSETQPIYIALQNKVTMVFAL